MNISDTKSKKLYKNCIRLSYSMYLVKNQSGFNNALYYYVREICGEDYHTRKYIRRMINCYPTKYPCLISLSNDLFERSAVYVDIADSGLIKNLYNTFSDPDLNWIKNC